MSSDAPSTGLLLVVSAPSGTGKTTIVEEAVAICQGLERSRSYTSRARRDSEVDGVDYNFVERPVFERLARQEAFLEWADVYGNLYGTGKRETAERRATGADVVLVIDVQGARQVRARADVVSVFVLPPSFATLESRLRARSEDPPEVIDRRLAVAREEVRAVDEYDYVMVNDTLERAVHEMVAIVQAERLRRGRRQGEIDRVRRTFEERNTP